VGATKNGGLRAAPSDASCPIMTNVIPNASDVSASGDTSKGPDEMVPYTSSAAFEIRKARAANEVQLSGRALEDCGRDLRSDREVVLLAVSKDGLALEHAAEEMKQDLEVVITAVRQTSFALRFVHEGLQQDPRVFAEAVFQNGALLANATQDLRRNRRVVIAAVTQNGTALVFADDSLRRDREIVLQAVRQNGSALIFAAQELRRDKEIVLEAVKQDGFELAHSSEELRRDYDVVHRAVLQNGAALRFASKEFRANPGIVLAAVERYAEALHFACEDLQLDRGFILNAVKCNPAVLGVVRQEVYMDRSFVLACVVQDPAAAEYAPDDLKLDLELVGVIVGQDYRLIDASVGAPPDASDDTELEIVDETDCTDEDVFFSLELGAMSSLRPSPRHKFGLQALELGTAAASMAALHDNFDEDPRSTDKCDSAPMDRHEFVFACTRQKIARQTYGTQQSIDYRSERSELIEEKTEREFILTAVRTSTEAMEFLPAEARRDREVVIALLTDKHSRVSRVKQQIRMRDESKDGVLGQEASRSASKEWPPDVIRLIMAPQRLSLEHVETVFRQYRGQYWPGGPGSSALQYAAKALLPPTLGSFENMPSAILAAVGQHGATMVDITSASQKPCGRGSPHPAATLGTHNLESDADASLAPVAANLRDPRGAVEDVSIESIASDKNCSPVSELSERSAERGRIQVKPKSAAVSPE
jgi:hypothetical protein